MAHWFSHQDRTVPLNIRKHARARRMIVRYQTKSRSVELTLPRYVSVRQGLAFVERARGWIASQMAREIPILSLNDGAEISVMGRCVRLRYVGGRGVMQLQEENGVRALLIPGNTEFIERRVRDWLKKQVLAEITALAKVKSEMLGKPHGRIRLRDTRSLWGSCTPKGDLTFSWRLVFAPYDVLEYLVAHEVAHLKHAHHRATFWQTVALLCPNYETSRDWLREHGAQLHRYGTN